VRAISRKPAKLARTEVRSGCLERHHTAFSSFRPHF
jgi:hypothetical protein